MFTDHPFSAVGWGPDYDQGRSYVVSAVLLYSVLDVLCSMEKLSGLGMYLFTGLEYWTGLPNRSQTRSQTITRTPIVNICSTCYELNGVGIMLPY